MATIITDLKETFRRGNIYIQLIYINVAEKKLLKWED